MAFRTATEERCKTRDLRNASIRGICKIGTNSCLQLFNSPFAWNPECTSKCDPLILRRNVDRALKVLPQMSCSICASRASSSAFLFARFSAATLSFSYRSSSALSKASFSSGNVTNLDRNLTEVRDCFFVLTLSNSNRD